MYSLKKIMKIFIQVFPMIFQSLMGLGNQINNLLPFSIALATVLWAEKYCHFTLVLFAKWRVAGLFLHPILLIDFGVVGLEPGMCNGIMCFIKVPGFIGGGFNGVEVFGILTRFRNGSMVRVVHTTMFHQCCVHKPCRLHSNLHITVLL